MTTKVPNRGQRITANQKLIDGAKRHQNTLTSLVIDGTLYETADIVATLQRIINSAQGVVSSKADWQSAVQADKQTRQKAQALVSSLKQTLHVAFGNSSDTLADFGMIQRKTRIPRTPEQKAASTVKARATRVARHTMGVRQKAQIKGRVATTPAVDPSASG
jgi:hypothetical protein